MAPEVLENRHSFSLERPPRNKLKKYQRLSSERLQDEQYNQHASRWQAKTLKIWRRSTRSLRQYDTSVFCVLIKY
jgi:hypothetical protein